METAKRDIDDIWCKLKQRQPHSSRSQSFEQLWSGLHSETSSSKGRQPAPGASRGELQFYLHKVGSQQHAQHAATPKPPDTSLQSHGLDGAALERLLKSLVSSDAPTRRAALQQIKASYSSNGNSSSSTAASAVAGALRSKLGKSLLRSFDDHSEACRQLAITVFKEALQASPDAALAMLPYAMPVLEERLHTDESTRDPIEPSEEVRLLLVQLLSIILDQAGTAIAAYASEVWSMLSAALADRYHEVAMQGCKVAQQLAGILGLRLSPLAKDIVAALLPLTTHKRHRVRIAAIEAIRDVMHQGAHEMILEMVAWRDPNMVPIKAFYGDDLKVNYCGKLATDHHVQVRLAFLQMTGNWMLTLRERSDHEARLLPYLLNGLCDESTAVTRSALQLLQQLGQQYEQEHEKDLADLVRFGDSVTDPSETRFLSAVRDGTAVYPPTAVAANVDDTNTAEASSRTEVPLEANSQEGGKAVFSIPGPFPARPRLGSRLLVQNNFGSALSALCGDLSSWQSGPRAMSAKLLLVNLVLAESAAERHLQVLLPALYASIRDPDAGATVADCAALLGSHCDFGLVLDLLEPRLIESVDVDSRRQADALLVLAAVLRGAGPLHRLSGHSTRLLQLLQHSSIAGSQDSNIKTAATAVMHELLKPGVAQQLLEHVQTAEQQQQPGAGDSSAEDSGGSNPSSSSSSSTISFELLAGYTNILLQLAASEPAGPAAAVDSHAAAAQAPVIEQLLQKLACAAGYPETDELLGVCRQRLIQKVTSQLDLHSAAAVSVLCRLMLPSACSWLLTASPVATARCSEPLATAADYKPWLTSTNSSSHSSSTFTAAAASYCKPEHLKDLCRLVAAAQKTYSKDAQHTPASMNLLLFAVDCCMAVWPAAAFTQPVLQELLHRMVPVLLSSTRSVAVMAGLRALHHAVLRGFLAHLDDLSSSQVCASNHQRKQQQQEGISGHDMLLEVWKGQPQQRGSGLCQLVCRVLESDVAAVRLEACHLLQCLLDMLGCKCLVQQEPEQQQSGNAAAAAAPQPAASLTAALDDADHDVRAAANRVLQQLLDSPEGVSGQENGRFVALQQRLQASAVA